MELGEHEHDALIFRQRSGCARDRRTELCAAVLALRRCTRWRGVGGLEWRARQHRALAMIEREPRRDREQPGRRLGLGFDIESRECAERAQERLLREVV